MAVRYDLVLYGYYDDKAPKVLERGLLFDDLIKRIQYHNSKNVTGNSFLAGETSKSTPGIIKVSRGYKDIHRYVSVLA